ncbi:MAG: PASTA domain-containing protein [Paenibacillaceae bacterium]|nr:PASTA domain-containing protein [Paenibacillaceae bacterium]
MHKKMKLRSLLIGVVFSLLFGALIARMYWVQVVDASWLQGKAEVRWQDNEIIRAKRGTITDRDGRPLAEDTVAYTVALNPTIIAESHVEREVARGLAQILVTAGGDVGELENKIYAMATKKRADSDKLLQEVEVRNEGWKIDGETKQKVDAFIEELAKSKSLRKKSSTGIYLKETTMRYYPYSRLASQVLGYVDKEGTAKYGVESMYNDLLSGTPGKLSRQQDRMGIELPDSKVSLTPAVNGNDIMLTIDEEIQYITEQAIQKMMDKYHPKSITAVVADPKTMEILAMANAPDFNPNRYWEIDGPEDFKNDAISSQYEPGSTFKLVTLAGTIEEGLFNPNDTYQSGSIVITGQRLNDHQIGGWGKISFLEGLLRSSNVAFVKLGYEKLGMEKLRGYIDKFGFGAKTGIDLPQEAAGQIGMRYPVEYATATYGQGLTATVIQQVAAYGAIANGGKLMWPHVLKQISDSETGEAIQKFEPKFVRQVVTEETAKQAGLDLEQVVANKEGGGTGWRAYIDGYRVAGKTGTAQVVRAGEKTYSTDTWVVSFIGYAPVDNPRVLVAIVADQPDLKGDYHEGGNVTGPPFKEIMQQTLRHLEVKASAAQVKSTTAESMTVVPDVQTMTSATAKTKLAQAGLQLETYGKGNAVLRQYPAPGTEVSMTQRVYATLADNDTIPLPELAGKSLREALEVCSFLQLACKTNGTGYVTGQTAADGDGGKSVELTLQPLSETYNAPAGNAAKTTGNKADTPSNAKKP